MLGHKIFRILNLEYQLFTPLAKAKFFILHYKYTLQHCRHRKMSVNNSIFSVFRQQLFLTDEQNITNILELSYRNDGLHATFIKFSGKFVSDVIGMHNSLISRANCMQRHNHSSSSSVVLAFYNGHGRKSKLSKVICRKLHQTSEQYTSIPY